MDNRTENIICIAAAMVFIFVAGTLMQNSLYWLGGGCLLISGIFGVVVWANHNKKSGN